MNFQNPVPHDPFHGNLVHDEGYHQDYREHSWDWRVFSFTQVGLFLASVLFLSAVVYHVLLALDYDLLPLPELLWNALVYATPSRLLDAIENYTSPLRISNPHLRDVPRTHAEKSEIMRRILGLDTGGIISTVTSAGRRRLSTLPGINVGLGGEGRPAGLGNWDNSCYQNSVLQGLASLDSLSEYLKDPRVNEEIGKATEEEDMRMAGALRGLIEVLNDSSNNGRRIWTPATLKSMSSWQQQDAQEYFSKVLDEIDKEVGTVANRVRISQGFETENLSSSSQTSSSQAISTFRNPLEGLIAQRVCCTRCGYSEGLSMIPFNCLTVPLGRAWEYDVSECLDEYTKLEQIEGVECGKCTLLKNQNLLSKIAERVKGEPEDNLVRKTTMERLEAVNAALEDDDYEEKSLQRCKIPPKNRVSSTKSRQAVIARPPKSLVVHFNRSLFDELTGELRKNTAQVRFPKVLDLGSWCLGSAGGKTDEAEKWLLDPDIPMISGTFGPSRLRGPLYELRAVVTHYGRHENGHYICYKKHPGKVLEDRDSGDWWRLSDDDVIKVSEENVLGQGGVFMLFFDCVEPATAIPPCPAEPSLSDLELAASIALPESDDSDLSDSEEHNSSVGTRESSIATSISSEEDSHVTVKGQDYSPAKAVLVPPYLKSSEGVYTQGGQAHERHQSSSNLVMV